MGIMLTISSRWVVTRIMQLEAFDVIDFHDGSESRVPLSLEEFDVGLRQG